MKRRDFVRTAPLAAVGMLALPSFLAGCKSQKSMGQYQKSIGLQLYTLRDTITTDPKGVLKQVAGFGITELETFGYADGKIFGLDFTEFCKYVKGLGMNVVSGHYGLDKLKGDTWKKAVDDAKKNGQKYMVCPYIAEPQRKSIDDYKRICADLNAAGEVCNQSNIRFQYHNHAFEFETLDGQIPFDFMLKELDPKKVGMEMDIFWVVNAGQDPIKYFQKYPGRFEQWHVKDMDKNDKNKNADVGTGAIDYKPIFAQAKLSGMKNWYIEQETYPGAPIDSVGASAKFLKTIL
jgi:sugar phosphate isomerase/epimerase